MSGVVCLHTELTLDPVNEVALVTVPEGSSRAELLDGLGVGDTLVEGVTVLGV